jgi:protein involved in polysaccharide export with SLBB domain
MLDGDPGSIGAKFLRSRPMSRSPLLALLTIGLIGWNSASGQEPSKPQDSGKPETELRPPIPPTDRVPSRPNASETSENPRTKPFPESPDQIKPLPLVAIPDDPPPHEGAFIDLPLTIEPPDIINIEVLEALPGRPITGDFLVQSNGKISLGFYGDLFVRGLTAEQVKAKVLLHLRKYLTDEVLGLFTVEETMDQAEPNRMIRPPEGTSPFDVDQNPAVPAKPKEPELPEIVPPELLKKPMPIPAEPPKSASRPGSRNPDRMAERTRNRVGSTKERRAIRRTSAIIRNRTEAVQDPVAPPAPPPDAVLNQVPGTGQFDERRIHPADSLRCYVVITHHNSKVYFVQGDVANPGRLPCTGTDTVLDALNYAGGFVPTAEPGDIHLYRLARGGKPVKDYKIDHAAILRGEALANLQMFPGDRLVVGRNAIVKKTIEVDRVLSPMNSILNHLYQQSMTARALGAVNIPLSSRSATPAMTPAQQEAAMKAYFEFVLSITSKDSGALTDESKFREALMKKLSIPNPVIPEGR